MSRRPNSLRNLPLIFLLPAGLLIYSCYGVWHSTLELEAVQQQAQASSYQRFEEQLDDTFFYPEEEQQQHQQEEEGPYQGWSAPEERGYSYQPQDEQQEGAHRGYQSSSGGRTNHGFRVSDEEG